VGLIRRIRALFHEEKLSTDLDEELQYHLAMREGLNTDAGMPQTEARLAARRSFGNLTLLKESTRDADLFVLLETVLMDVHFAARMLAKHRGFTALAVAALAIGIGVNTAVFTACKAVLLQPLDAKDPRQLVNVYRSTPQRSFDPSFSYPDFEFYRDHNRVFSGLVATTGGGLAMTTGQGIANTGNSIGGGLAQAFGFRMPSVMGGSSQFVSFASVSDNYFAVLGVGAIRGRVFLPQDTKDLDAHPAILISENFWQRHFAGDPSILGKSVKLNGAPFTIIGITPHDFVGTIINVPNVWLPMRNWPLASKNSTILHDREEAFCTLYGRLAQGVSLQQAQAEMNLLADHLRALHAPHSEGSRATIIRLTPGSHIGPVHVLDDPGLAFSLLFILGAVGLVLLIACANVSSLQLARSAARQKEIGIRLSVGASRFRIIRQLLTESALLGLVAGVVSLLMTWWALRLLMVGIAASLPTEWGSLALHVEPDLHVFAYVFLLSMFASVLFGLAPALQSSRPSLSAALKEEGSAFALRISSSRMRDLLMGMQAAACLFLLIGAGLLIRGSIRSMVLSPGYETKHVVSLDVVFPPGLGYTHAKQLAEVNQLLGGISNVPGVRAISEGIPPDGGGLRTAAVGLNGLKPSTDNTARTAFYSYVASNYFDCLDIALVAGHTFPGQPAAPEPTVILSESAVAEFWPGENPLGKRVALDASKQFHDRRQQIPQGLVYEVIGVAKDTRAITPDGNDNRKAYLSLTTDRMDGGVPLLVRFKSDPKPMLLELGKQLHAVDPNLVVYATTLEDLLTSTPRFVLTRLAAIFASIIGGLGLVLACVGIYGTVSYAVARRTRQVGIRMALGARKGDVLRMIVFESGRPVMIGSILGGAAAAGASNLLRSLLFGLNTLDPISFLYVGSLFLAISLLAAYFPARRAAHIDPMVALRCD
jgi:macrolide transport system ATP-binding/permease protein